MPPVVKAALRPPAPTAVRPEPQQDLSLHQLLRAVRVADLAGALDHEEGAPLDAPQKPAADLALATGDQAEWSQILDIVQDFGARVRRARTLAQDLTTRSQEMIATSKAAADAANARADRAESAARDNAVTLEQIRKQLRAAEERARLAEERLRAAEASESEARKWLQKISSALRHEYEGLGDVFAEARSSVDDKAA